MVNGVNLDEAVCPQTERQAMIKQNQLLQADQELQRIRDEKNTCFLRCTEFEEAVRKAESMLHDCMNKEVDWNL